MSSRSAPRTVCVKYDRSLEVAALRSVTSRWNAENARVIISDRSAAKANGSTRSLFYVQLGLQSINETTHIVSTFWLTAFLRTLTSLYECPWRISHVHLFSILKFAFICTTVYACYTHVSESILTLRVVSHLRNSSFHRTSRKFILPSVSMQSAISRYSTLKD